jgi:hypothetical protein
MLTTGKALEVSITVSGEQLIVRSKGEGTRYTRAETA